VLAACNRCFRIVSNNFELNNLNFGCLLGIVQFYNKELCYPVRDIHVYRSKSF